MALAACSSTHLKRLSGVETALANFFASGQLLLGEKLGPILWQLPANISFDGPLLTAFFDLLPRHTDDAAALASQHDDKVSPARASTMAPVAQPIRYALEVRHDSFREQRAPRLLERHGVSLVLADSAGRWPMIDEATSDLTYVRLHGHTTLYTSGYASASLDRWAERCLHLGRTGAGRLRLLRQRCARARPARCSGPPGEARRQTGVQAFFVAAAGQVRGRWLTPDGIGSAVPDAPRGRQLCQTTSPGVRRGTD